MRHLEEAINVCGSQSELAKQIGVAPQVVNNWLRRKNIPAEHCPEIEKATGGAVRCEELRPDVDWAYLRKSSNEEAA
jgi:DNA-binding transcriptional regulator YdaS (Cro superfamily)